MKLTAKEVKMLSDATVANTEVCTLYLQAMAARDTVFKVFEKTVVASIVETARQYVADNSQKLLGDEYTITDNLGELGLFLTSMAEAAQAAEIGVADRGSNAYKAINRVFVNASNAFKRLELGWTMFPSRKYDGYSLTEYSLTIKRANNDAEAVLRGMLERAVKYAADKKLSTDQVERAGYDATLLRLATSEDQQMERTMYVVATK